MYTALEVNLDQESMRVWREASDQIEDHHLRPPPSWMLRNISKLKIDHVPSLFCPAHLGLAFPPRYPA